VERTRRRTHEGSNPETEGGQRRGRFAFGWNERSDGHTRDPTWKPKVARDAGDSPSGGTNAATDTRGIQPGDRRWPETREIRLRVERTRRRAHEESNLETDFAFKQRDVALGRGNEAGKAREDQIWCEGYSKADRLDGVTVSVSWSWQSARRVARSVDENRRTGGRIAGRAREIACLQGHAPNRW